MNNVIIRTVRNSGLATGAFSPMILALALLVTLGVPQVSATTYNFVIPVGTQVNPNPNSLLGALAAQIGTPTNFAFYDFYIRPELASDTVNGLIDHPGPINLIADYSMSASVATAPIPGCASFVDMPSPCAPTYSSTSNAIEPAFGGAAAHFRFNPSDNVIALVTENQNAGDKNYNGQPLVNPFPGGATTRTEIMPSAASFAFTFNTSEYSAFQTPQITFEVYALGMRYTSIGATSLASKDTFVVGDFEAVGEAPEPSTIFVAGGGLCLLAFARFRRRHNITT
jgi:hypothetical protein